MAPLQMRSAQSPRKGRKNAVKASVEVAVNVQLREPPMPSLSSTWLFKVRVDGVSVAGGTARTPVKRPKPTRAGSIGILGGEGGVAWLKLDSDLPPSSSR